MNLIIARWTLEDDRAMLDRGILAERPVELLNGLIVEMTPEGTDHADLSTDLAE